MLILDKTQLSASSGASFARHSAFWLGGRATAINQQVYALDLVVRFKL